MKFLAGFLVGATFGVAALILGAGLVVARELFDAGDDEETLDLVADWIAWEMELEAQP